MTDTLLSVRESNGNRIAGSSSFSFELVQSVTKEAAEEAAENVSEIITVTSDLQSAEGPADEESTDDQASVTTSDSTDQETETVTETTDYYTETETTSETEETETTEATETTETTDTEGETVSSEESGETEGETQKEAEEEAVSQEKTENEITGETDPWDLFPSINEAPYDDVAILCQIVMCEAGSEDIIGQIMVANVILNRVNADGFGSSVYDVVFAAGQFEPVSSGFYWMVTPTESVREAVYRALNGEDYSEGALFFCSRYYSSWHDAHLTYVTEHGGHIFYR